MYENLSADRPVHLRWIEGDPPQINRERTGGNSMRHDLIAAALKAKPGVWAMLPDLYTGQAADIGAGKITSYRPGGTFEAVARGDNVYARYVGERNTDG